MDGRDTHATDKERYDTVFYETIKSLTDPTDLNVFGVETRSDFIPVVLYHLDFDKYTTKKDLTSKDFKEAVAVAARMARTEAIAAVRQAQLRAIAGNPENKDFESLTSTQKAKVLHTIALLNETKGVFEASLHIIGQLQGTDFQPGEVTKAFNQVVEEMDRY